MFVVQISSIGLIPHLSLLSPNPTSPHYCWSELSKNLTVTFYQLSLMGRALHTSALPSPSPAPALWAITPVLWSTASLCCVKEQTTIPSTGKRPSPTPTPPGEPQLAFQGSAPQPPPCCLHSFLRTPSNPLFPPPRTQHLAHAPPPWGTCYLHCHCQPTTQRAPGHKL